MATILLRFIVLLEEHNSSTIVQHYGPLFHRWLPDGEKDCIVLDTGETNAQLKVWFERRGFVDNGWIKFDYNRQEIDPKIIPQQGILEAGPLMGSLEIQGVSEDDLASIRENNIGDARRYVALSKKIATELLYPPLNRFINILRTNYGQHWIAEFGKWDSRKASLGGYCNGLRLKWSQDGGHTWNDFIPNERRLSFNSFMPSAKDFVGYLTKEDWKELAKVVYDGFEPSLATITLARAHQLADQGDMRYAFVEGCSALELAINEFVRHKSKENQTLIKAMKSFRGLPLRAQVTTITMNLDSILLQDLEYTIEAIGIRNKIVHEDFNPSNNTKKELYGLLNTVAALLPGPRFRFPAANIGNANMVIEKWEQEEISANAKKHL